jgi:hypothetical protein
LFVLAASPTFASEFSDADAKLNNEFAEFFRQSTGTVCKNPSVLNVAVVKADWRMSADIVCGDPGERVTYVVFWDHGKSDVQPESH